MAELANQPSHHGGLPTSCWRLPIFVSRLCQTRRSPCLPPCHATFRHSRLPRNLACGSIFFVKIRNGHSRASFGQNLPRARSPPVLESRLCCFATEAMQNCTRFGSFENPSILLSGLRVAVRFHYSGMGKAQTPQGCFRSSKSEKVRSRATTAEGP